MKKDLTITSLVNLEGGIGKTTIAFNLAYYLKNALIIDADSQQDLTTLINQNGTNLQNHTIYDYLLPYLLSGYSKPEYKAFKISELNSSFKKFFGEDNTNYFIPSSEDLSNLASQLFKAIQQAKGLKIKDREVILEHLDKSLKTEIKTFCKSVDVPLSNCLIDTSSYYPGETKLSVIASDYLIVPMGVSVSSLYQFEQLINILKTQFKKSVENTPKIKAIVFCLKKCASVQKLKEYIAAVKKLINKNSELFTNDFKKFLMFDLEEYSYYFIKEQKPIGFLLNNDNRKSLRKAQDLFYKLSSLIEGKIK